MVATLPFKPEHTSIYTLLFSGRISDIAVVPSQTLQSICVNTRYHRYHFFIQALLTCSSYRPCPKTLLYNNLEKQTKFTKHL